MNTDLEQELRELFRDKVGDAPAATPDVGDAAGPVLRRAQLRQVGTVVGSAAIAFAIAIGSVAGLSAILRARDPDLVGGTYDVFERTATIEAFTVTSPSDWYLVNQWPRSISSISGAGSASQACTVDTAGNETCTPIERSNPVCAAGPATGDVLERCPVEGMPVLQLSNDDVGLDHNVCRDGLSNTAAALYVALDVEGALAGVSDPSVGPFETREIPPATAEPCSAGRSMRFTVNGEPFFAWIGVGPDVSPDDRATVMDAFASLVVDDEWVPTEPDTTAPAYVLAGGVASGGEDWRLELRPSGSNVELSLAGDEPGGSAAGFTVPDVPIESCCEYDEGYRGVAFGAVAHAATGVEFHPSDGGDPIAGRILPLPPTLARGFDVFYVEGTDGLSGDVVATGLEGRTAEPTTEPSTTVEPSADVVSLSGGDATTTWIVRFIGTFDDGSACIVVRVVGGTPDRLCPGPDGIEDSLAGPNPSLHLWVLPSVTLLAGSVPPEVRDVRFISDEGEAARPAILELQCTGGPLGWSDKDVCALALSREGSGTLEYLDADGAVVFEEGIGWGSAPALPQPVDPLHGNTYWAVYAWLDTQGGPASNAVVDRLFDDYGIQAWQGELACDEGAPSIAEYSWKVAVYFETEQDAQVFAKRTGLTSAGPWEPVARVTTYCLD